MSVSTLPPGMTRASPPRPYSSWCSFLWRRCSIHKICIKARATWSIFVRRLSMIRQIIKGIITVGHLPTPDSWHRSRRVVIEARQPWACGTRAVTYNQVCGPTHLRSHTRCERYRRQQKAHILGPRERERERERWDSKALLLDPSGTSTNPWSRLISCFQYVAQTLIAEYDHFDGLLQQAVHLLPAKVFTEGSPTIAVCKRRVSSLEAVSHDLFEESQDLQESLEGEAKKCAKEVRKIFFQTLFFPPEIVTPRLRGRSLPRRSAIQRLGDTDKCLLRGLTTTSRQPLTELHFGQNFSRGIIRTWGPLEAPFLLKWWV